MHPQPESFEPTMLPQDATEVATDLATEVDPFADLLDAVAKGDADESDTELPAIELEMGLEAELQAQLQEQLQEQLQAQPEAMFEAMFEAGGQAEVEVEVQPEVEAPTEVEVEQAPEVEFETTPHAAFAPEPEAALEAPLEAGPELEPEPQAQLQTQSEAMLEAGVQAQAQPEVEFQAEPQAALEIEPETAFEAPPQAVPEAEPEPEPQAQLQTQPEVETAPATQVQAEPQPALQPAPPQAALAPEPQARLDAEPETTLPEKAAEKAAKKAPEPQLQPANKAPALRPTTESSMELAMDPAPADAATTSSSTTTPSSSSSSSSSGWTGFLAQARERVSQPLALEVRGTLTRLAGLVLEAKGIRVPVGAQCLVSADAHTSVLAEVVGFTNERALLMPAGDVQGLSNGASVAAVEPFMPMPRLDDAPNARAAATRSGALGALRLPLGDGLLGRVVDSQGAPLDRKGPIANVVAQTIARQATNAMDRDPVRETLDTGVRAINALLTVGRGQRLGLFAGSGVGKSVLLGMMARYTQADVIVVGLVGERGREVKEFIEDILGPQGRARSVVVAAPADAPPLLRMQGADYASAIAEHFRDQGRHVLLLMDSLTRYAMAQREIALAIGEPPATKGYPPSCFSKLPKLVERSGNGLNGVGSITAFYTVLTEGDDLQDPIADAARAILDGHIVLTRSLAEAGHYPAIDVELSASRVMHNIVSTEHFELAKRFKAIYAKYTQSRDLVQIGAYAAGADPALDEAIVLRPKMEQFLQQGMQEASPMAGVADALAGACMVTHG